MRNFLRPLFVTLVMAGAVAPALADDPAPPTLPGGANAITEVHDDWTVRCGVAAQGATPAKTACGISQQLIDKTSKRRVLVIGLAGSDGGGVKGTLVMPFGLLLDAGITLQIDDGPQTAAIHFKTCLPVGCIVPIDWPATTVSALRTAKKLNIAAQSQNGQAAPFSISLKGFAGAIDRSADLAK